MRRWKYRGCWVDFHPFIKRIFSMMNLGLWVRPSGRINTCMRKAMVENPCINLGRIRKRRSMIRGRRDSNLLSIEMSLIKIIKTNMLRMNPREKTPWEKGEDHQSNVGDAKNITCTMISLTERTKWRPCTTSKKIQQQKTWEGLMQPYMIDKNSTNPIWSRWKVRT